MSGLPVLLIAPVVTLVITHRLDLALLTALLLALQVTYGLLTTVQRCLRKVREQALSAGLQSFVQISTIVGLAALALVSAATAIESLILSALAGCIYALFQLRHLITSKGDHAAPDFDTTRLVKEAFGYGVPFSVWFVAFQILQSGDRLVLVRFGVPGVGEYASLRDLVTGLAGLSTMPLLMAAHPVLMSLWQNKKPKSEIDSLVARNVSIVTLMLTFFSGLGLLSGPQAIKLVLGESYLVSGEMVALVVGNIYLAAIAMYAHKGLEVTGRIWTMAAAASIAASITLIACIVIARKGGVFGAALIGGGGMIIYISAVVLLGRDAIEFQWPKRLPHQVIWLIAAAAVTALEAFWLPELAGIWAETTAVFVMAYAWVIGIPKLKQAAGRCRQLVIRDRMAA
jgi:O-antigen/teichoic acid export membrane protein